MAIYTMESLFSGEYMGATQHKCEHIDLHHSLYDKGYRRIYYNPSMILFAGAQGSPRKDCFWKEVHRYLSEVIIAKN